MANQIRIKRRAAGGAAGAPAALKNAEIAYNEQDNVLYYGYGDDGGGNATSIIGIAGSGNNVTLGGTQTITGDKTFSGTVDLTGTFQIGGTAVTATAAELNYTGDLGDFTGATITSNADVKTALQELESALEDGSGSVAGDTGTAAFTGGSVTISGGTGITTTGDNVSTLSIDLDNTAVTAASYGTTAAKTVAFTVDAQGRLTAASEQDISIVHTQVSDFDTGVQANRLDQLAAPTADISLNNNKITGLADPVSSQDAATKLYVDNTAQGLDAKASVLAASVGDLGGLYNNGSSGVGATLTNNGAQAAFTLDGDLIGAGGRVLIKDQATALQNGIYTVTDIGSSSTDWILTRAIDLDEAPELPSAYVFVEGGDTNANNGYVCTNEASGLTVGVTGITFEQFSGAGQVDGGAGLTKTGNTLDIGTADTGRIVVNPDNIDLATVGTAGTYIGFTVDDYGRVSSFTSPTTLGGYGITDAQPLDNTLTALAGVTVAADQVIYATGVDTFDVTGLSTFGRSLIDDADAATAITTLGLGTISTQNADNVAITGGSIDNIEIDGGTF